MTKRKETPSVRQWRLAEIRREIAARTYETPERLSAAVDVLLVDLEGGSDSVDDRRQQDFRP
jgi:hypothetical protein